MSDELREVECHWPECLRVFLLCRRHDRGQRYCSRLCRMRAGRRRTQKARQRYARSDKGKRNNRERQRRFRARWRSAPKPGRAKSVTDHSSQTVEEEASWTGAATKSPPEPDRRPESLCVRLGVADAALERRPPSAWLPRQYVPGRCSICGRPGVVVRRVSPRGRFRWG
jgi:hypothetical protein